jgi:hypothetical protein
MAAVLRTSKKQGGVVEVNRHKRSPAVVTPGPEENDPATCSISSTDSHEQAAGQLVDKHGHVHTEAVYRNWSPAAIRVLGIRRVGATPRGPR